MPPWLKDVMDYLRSPPLHPFWYLMLGLVVGCYLFALVLVHAVPAQTTIIHRCRRAWGFAFLTHAVATVIVILSWYFSHRMLASFAQYFIPYVLMFAIEMLLGSSLLLSARRFQRYGD